MIASSATAGQPARPSRPESSPSFIWACSVSRGSWACWAMTPSNAFTYSSARRIITASLTHLPSSEKTRTRAAESRLRPWAISGATRTAYKARPDLLDELRRQVRANAAGRFAPTATPDPSRRLVSDGGSHPIPDNAPDGRRR